MGFRNGSGISWTICQQSVISGTSGYHRSMSMIASGWHCMTSYQCAVTLGQGGVTVVQLSVIKINWTIIVITTGSSVSK